MVRRLALLVAALVAGPEEPVSRRDLKGALPDGFTSILFTVVFLVSFSCTDKSKAAAANALGGARLKVDASKPVSALE